MTGKQTTKTMPEALLREISQNHLLPFFSGARIEPNPIPSKSSEKTMAFTSPQDIRFKVNKADAYRLQLRRDHPFAAKENPARETRVIEAFVSILEGMNSEVQGPLKDDLLSTFQRRVVARAVAEPDREQSLLAVIDQMALWATRLYEGAPITGAIGIHPGSAASSSLSLAEIAEQDFGAVLSNGFDTLLVFDENLNFDEHSILIPNGNGNHTCPWRHSAVAEWTAVEIGRVAVVLNRVGEILVFRDGQLLFARRSGTWHFLTHQPVIGQMIVPKDLTIRHALYETALDASFARTGACLGVVKSGSDSGWKKMIAESDQLLLGQSVKARALAKVVAGRKFHELNRTLRQELVAIDGATIINHMGEVLAVGAILQIPGGSTGGGRTAAARALAHLGLGIKISQDGGITAYVPDNDDEKVAFKVM